MTLIKKVLLVSEEKKIDIDNISIPSECPLSDRVYLLGKTGIYTYVENNFWHYISESNKFAKPVGYLPEISEVFYLYVSIPKAIAYRALRFFQLVFEKYKTEAVIIPFIKLNEETGEYEWELYIPKQKNSLASVKYELDMEELNLFFQRGFIKFGTIHSHSDFGAGHSGTDIHDEENIDGIHVTFGHVDQKQDGPVSISVSAVGAGSRYSYKNPLDAFDPDVFTDKLVVFDREAYNSEIFTEEELAKVSHVTVSTTKPGTFGYYGSNSWRNNWYTGSYYEGYFDNYHDLQADKFKLPALTVDFLGKFINRSKKEKIEFTKANFAEFFLKKGFRSPRAGLGVIDFSNFD